MRGSKLSRAVQWFREGNLDEIRVAFTLVKEIVDWRLENDNPSIVKAKTVKRRRSRKTLATASVEPVQVAS